MATFTPGVEVLKDSLDLEKNLKLHPLLSISKLFSTARRNKGLSLILSVAGLIIRSPFQTKDKFTVGERLKWDSWVVASKDR